jgi:hypothetical protein
MLTNEIECALIRNFLGTWNYKITRNCSAKLSIVIAPLLWHASLKSLALAVLHKITVYKLVFSWICEGKWLLQLQFVLAILGCVRSRKIIGLILPS